MFYEKDKLFYSLPKFPTGVTDKERDEEDVLQIRNTSWQDTSKVL